MTEIPEPLATHLLLLAAKNGTLEVKDEGEKLRVRGILFLSGPGAEYDQGLILGVAHEDIKKGQIGAIRL